MAPGGEPAGSGALLTAVLEMREELAGFRKEVREELAGLRKEMQADRPEPVTRDALEAWSGELLKKVGEMVPKENGAGGAAIAAHAGKMEAAAERIDTGLERTAERFSAEVAGTEKWLAEDRSVIRASMSGIESAAGRIEAGLKELAKNATGSFNDLYRSMLDIDEKMRTLKFGWRAVLAPWLIFIFAAGMALESRLHFFYGLLRDS